MGELTDALQANLRELAQSDARLLRELDALIPSGVAVGDPTVGGGTAVAQLDDGLERLSLKDLKELCKKRRIKGITKLKKDELIALLRSGAPAAPPTLGATGPVSSAGAPPALPSAAAGGQLASLEERLERIETLMQRIADHLGVS